MGDADQISVYQLLWPPASSLLEPLPGASAVHQPLWVSRECLQNPAWLTELEHLRVERKQRSASIVLYVTYAFPLVIDPEVDQCMARA